MHNYLQFLIKNLLFKLIFQQCTVLPQQTYYCLLDEGTLLCTFIKYSSKCFLISVYSRRSGIRAADFDCYFQALRLKIIQPNFQRKYLTCFTTVFFKLKKKFLNKYTFLPLFFPVVAAVVHLKGQYQTFSIDLNIPSY